MPKASPPIGLPTPLMHRMESLPPSPSKKISSSTSLLLQNEKKIAQIQSKLSMANPNPNSNPNSNSNTPPAGLKAPGPPPLKAASKSNSPPAGLKPPGPPPAHYKRTTSTFIHSASSSLDGGEDRSDTFQELNEPTPLPTPSPTTSPKPKSALRKSAKSSSRQKSTSTISFSLNPSSEKKSYNSGSNNSQFFGDVDMMDTIFDNQVVKTATLAPQKATLLAVKTANDKRRELTNGKKRGLTATSQQTDQYAVDEVSYTETVITEERLKGGKFATRIGYYMLFQAAMVLVVSLWVGSTHAIHSAIEYLVAEVSFEVSLRLSLNLSKT